MSFYKEYPNRKDWRKPYRDSRGIDSQCKNHGRCSWCHQNRTYADRRFRLIADEKLKEWYEDNE